MDHYSKKQDPFVQIRRIRGKLFPPLPDLRYL